MAVRIVAIDANGQLGPEMEGGEKNVPMQATSSGVAGGRAHAAWEGIAKCAAWGMSALVTWKNPAGGGGRQID